MDDHYFPVMHFIHAAAAFNVHSVLIKLKYKVWEWFVELSNQSCMGCTNTNTLALISHHPAMVL
jgi:hypothetical protein